MSKNSQADWSVRRAYIHYELDLPQPGFERFVTDFGRMLIDKADLKPLSAMHMPIAVTKGLVEVSKSSVIERDKGEKALTIFTGEYYEQAPAIINCSADSKEPLKIVGSKGQRWPRNQLAVNIAVDDQLRAERARAEEYLKSQLSFEPRLLSFLPHVTLGKVRKQWLQHKELWQPKALAENGVVIPDTIAFKGLKVFLNNRLQ